MLDDDRIKDILEEIWVKFHPAILWWSTKEAATDPKNVRMVYRELLSGPKGSMSYAVILHPLVHKKEHPEHAAH